MALTDNLISYYKLDGNSNDAVGSDNGTDTAITYSIANGKILQGAGFNGSSSKITASTISLASDFSLAFWVKFTQSAPTKQQIINWVNGNAQLNIYQDDDNKISCYLSDSNSVTSSIRPNAIGDGNWHQLILTKSSAGTVIVYVDGNSVGTDSKTFTGNFNSLVPYFGAYNGTSLWYTGALDEVGYWSRALTSGEVKSLWNGGAGLAYPLTINNGNMLLMF